MTIEVRRRTGDDEVYGLFHTGLFAARPAPAIADRFYFCTDTLVLYRDTGAAWVEVARGETATRLAQLAERAHGSLTGIGVADHHARYTDVEAVAAAKTVKLDDFTTPDDTTDLDAVAAKHGLMPKDDKVKLNGIEAGAQLTNAARVNAAGAVMETDYGAQTILRATLANTPTPLTVAEQRLVGRITAGVIDALTAAQVMALLSGQAAADFAMNTHKITGVVDPTANQEAATKKYVDDNAGGGDEIKDADSDTKIQAEEAADEDMIRMDVAGVEAFLLHDDGILDLVKQSSCKAYLGAIQPIPTDTDIPMKLDSESYDIQNEFAYLSKSGVADATVAWQLVDADGGFEASDVGKFVHNTTDDTYAQVTNFIDNSHLNVNPSIFVLGEGYTIYSARFTAKKAGRYLVFGLIAYGLPGVVADKAYDAYIFKNGLGNVHVAKHSSHVAEVNPIAFSFVDLDADDYLELWTRHTTGATAKTRRGATFTFLAIYKLS